ncbi:MAG TPA: hypothetical protein VFT22_23925 [Kofleriaceae bacterium]|nr:hypothetical protein [Kofleriaceae bacterium]
MSTDKKFNSPQDLEHVEPRYALPAGVSEKAFFEATKLAVFPGALLGNWVNVNPGTRGIVRIALQLSGATFQVHPFGACVPTPCDWGTQPGIAYAANVSSTVPVAFSAMFPAGFKDTIVVGHLENNLLVVETFNHFKDGSARSDYYAREVFHRG